MPDGNADASVELDTLARAEAVGEPVSDPKAVEANDKVQLDRRALLSLLLQHLSSSWGSRSFEFASFLFLIELFPQTLLPASILGFVTTGSSLILAGFVGHLVDTTPRLRFVRSSIVLQKASVGLAYALFLILFLRPRRNDGGLVDERLGHGFLVLIVIASSVLAIATIGINVAVERDWVTTIADGKPDRLTVMNTWMRRIDLVTKLLAPLFVSLLTTAVSYPFCVAFLIGYSVVTMGVEFFWIQVVFKRFAVLAEDDEKRMQAHKESAAAAKADKQPLSAGRVLARSSSSHRRGANDWQEFIASPIFPSSLAVSLLYLTVLSFDGTFVSWLKSHDFGDPFIAGMRGVNVVTGLLGTVLQPALERWIGLVRTGTWSILSEVASLVPVTIAFFVGAPPPGQRGPPWNSALLFTGLALSRIGLWSFDLTQLKELQLTLEHHPRRNSLTALQYSLQNIFDLVKYALTMGLNRPDQFKWAALVSFGAVCCGAVSYLFYSRKQRGHLLHFEYIPFAKKMS